MPNVEERARTSNLKGDHQYFKLHVERRSMGFVLDSNYFPITTEIHEIFVLRASVLIIRASHQLVNSFVKIAKVQNLGTRLAPPRKTHDRITTGQAGTNFTTEITTSRKAFPISLIIIGSLGDVYRGRSREYNAMKETTRYLSTPCPFFEAHAQRI